MVQGSTGQQRGDRVTAAVPLRRRGRLLARVVTEVFAPTVLLGGQLVAIGWHAGEQAGVSRWWGLLGAVVAVGVPLAYVLRGVRQGRLADHHIPDREHRRVPLLVGMASLTACLLLLLALGAPRELLAVLLSTAVAVVVFVVVTHWWKISIHAGVAAATVVVLVTAYGAAALFTSPVVVLVGWSRVRLAVHTPAQVVVGALVGGLIAALTFPPLR